MRRRLTIAILVVVAASLAVTAIGSFYFIQRAALSTGQQELASEARAISTTVSSGPTIARDQRELRVIANAGSFAGIQVVRLYPNGSIVGTLPSRLTSAQLDIHGLQAGRQTTGHTRSLLAYSAVPIPVARITAFVPVLVITRQIHNPVSGLRYFALVGAIALVVAALVAAGLARRFTRPLVDAVRTTGRIARGDLDASMAVGPGEDREFAQLAESINTMASNLVRARDQERQFILSVSHELRTPLTSIRGYADAVIDGATDDPAAAATVISAEARRLERLVQDLLDLARLDADRFSLELHTVDCAQVVRQIADGFRPRAAQLGLELVTTAGSDQPLWVHADADRLGQMVANLVENASSFAEHRIAIGAGVVGGMATAWVVDDGPGLPAGQSDRVFQRHFVSDRVSGRRKGSGLGLAIVAELAAAMGASVRAESPVAAGRGTRMVVRFPPGTSPPALPPLPKVPEARAKDDPSSALSLTPAHNREENSDG
jgi:signal transduction histidine kinase